MINRLRNRLAGHPNGALLGVIVVLSVVAAISIATVLVIAAGQWFFVLSPLWLRFGVTALAITTGIYWPLRGWLHDDTQAMHNNNNHDYYYTEEEVQS